MDEETDQLQQLYDTDKSASHISAPHSYKDLIRASTQDIMDHLNL